MTIISQQTGQFDGYTITELRALVLRMLRATDTSRYSPTAGSADYDWIDDALNRAQEDFVRRTRCLRSYAVIELKANYRTYRLPWNFLDLMAAYYYVSTESTGYYEVVITTIEDLNIGFSDWRTKTGNPTHIYIDRVYGNNWMFGLYPIPQSDGGDITFDSEYGTVVEWVCPLFTYNLEYGTVVRMTDTDEFLLNTDSGVVARVEEMNLNLWLEYYRLPEKLVYISGNLGTQGLQYPEIPREYQKALTYYAAADLLSNNPEDSAEFKRSARFMQQFNGEIKTYIDRRKPSLTGHNLQATPFVHTWLHRMEWRNTA